ncbi:hypothetical protein C8F01DRAFT_1079692 [Mycena amicta]|nr:hypothetical protein C8F01DRAFT_1079692 [Mycena amicta]
MPRYILVGEDAGSSPAFTLVQAAEDGKSSAPTTTCQPGQSSSGDVDVASVICHVVDPRPFADMTAYFSDRVPAIIREDYIDAGGQVAPNPADAHFLFTESKHDEDFIRRGHPSEFFSSGAYIPPYSYFPKITHQNWIEDYLEEPGHPPSRSSYTLAIPPDSMGPDTAGRRAFSFVVRSPAQCAGISLLELGNCASDFSPAAVRVDECADIYVTGPLVRTFPELSSSESPTHMDVESAGIDVGGSISTGPSRLPATSRQPQSVSTSAPTSTSQGLWFGRSPEFIAETLRQQRFALRPYHSQLSSSESPTHMDVESAGINVGGSISTGTSGLPAKRRLHNLDPEPVTESLPLKRHRQKSGGSSHNRHSRLKGQIPWTSSSAKISFTGREFVEE